MPAIGRLKIAKKSLPTRDKSRLASSRKKERINFAPMREEDGGITLGEDRVRVDRDRGYGGKRKEGRERNRGEGTSTSKASVLSTLLRLKGSLDKRKADRVSKVVFSRRIGDLEKVWLDTVANFHFVPRRWGKVERGAMRTLFTKHDRAKKFVSLMQWSIENWAHCVSTGFKWMKKGAPPISPDPLFFVRFYEVFAKARLSNRERKFRLEDDFDLPKFAKTLKKAADKPPKVKTFDVKLRRSDLGGKGIIPTKTNQFVWRETDD